MRIRNFPPGSLVAKINWDNEVIDQGIVIQQDPRHPLVDTQVLFTSGTRWEAAHDLVHIHELPIRPH